MISNKRAFTLVELLVVVAMIAIIMGALTTSVKTAQQRARIQKAKTEVNSITQAILAYENYAQGDYGDANSYRLEQKGSFGKGGLDANATTLGFLLGKGSSAKSGGQIPVLLMAALEGGGTMSDPWGTPYKFYIKPGTASMKFTTITGTLQTRVSLPNFYNLKRSERVIDEE